MDDHAMSIHESVRMARKYFANDCHCGAPPYMRHVDAESGAGDVRLMCEACDVAGSPRMVTIEGESPEVVALAWNAAQAAIEAHRVFQGSDEHAAKAQPCWSCGSVPTVEDIERDIYILRCPNSPRCGNQCAISAEGYWGACCAWNAMNIGMMAMRAGTRDEADD